MNNQAIASISTVTLGGHTVRTLSGEKTLFAAKDVCQSIGLHESAFDCLNSTECHVLDLAGCNEALLLVSGEATCKLVGMADATSPAVEHFTIDLVIHMLKSGVIGNYSRAKASFIDQQA